MITLNRIARTAAAIALGARAAALFHPYKRNSGDVALESKVDWQAVLAQASTFLTPDQIAALHESVSRFGH